MSDQTPSSAYPPYTNSQKPRTNLVWKVKKPRHTSGTGKTKSGTGKTKIGTHNDPSRKALIVHLDQLLLGNGRGLQSEQILSGTRLERLAMVLSRRSWYPHICRLCCLKSPMSNTFPLPSGTSSKKRIVSCGNWSFIREVQGKWETFWVVVFVSPPQLRHYWSAVHCDQ